MLPEIPLTAEAEALKMQILAIPRTDEPLDLDTLRELSAELMEDLFLLRAKARIGSSRN